MITRYAIKMRNGSYISLPFDDVSDEFIWVFSVGLPIDAELFKTKEDAEKFLNDILNGSLRVLVGFDKKELPLEVEELEISYQVK